MYQFMPFFVCVHATKSSFLKHVLFYNLVACLLNIVFIKLVPLFLTIKCGHAVIYFCIYTLPGVTFRIKESI